MHYTRKNMEATMGVAAPARQIFPLLCPVREYEWIASWRCTLVYSTTGAAELGCVFQTEFPGDPIPDTRQDTWVVSRYEPPHAIAFVRHNGERTIRYTITLAESCAGTRLLWHQELTGLSDAGNAMVEAATPQQFCDLVRRLELMLNHFCATGQCLAPEALERLMPQDK